MEEDYSLISDPFSILKLQPNVYQSSYDFDPIYYIKGGRTIGGITYFDRRDANPAYDKYERKLLGENIKNLAGFKRSRYASHQACLRQGGNVKYQVEWNIYTGEKNLWKLWEDLSKAKTPEEKEKIKNKFDKTAKKLDDNKAKWIEITKEEIEKNKEEYRKATDPIEYLKKKIRDLKSAGSNSYQVYKSGKEVRTKDVLAEYQKKLDYLEHFDENYEARKKVIEENRAKEEEEAKIEYDKQLKFFKEEKPDEFDLLNTKASKLYNYNAEIRRRKYEKALSDLEAEKQKKNDELDSVRQKLSYRIDSRKKAAEEKAAERKKIENEKIDKLLDKTSELKDSVERKRGEKLYNLTSNK